jgi:hypothetical protein
MTDYDLRDRGFINYDALSNIERELREQYAIQETEGVRYKRPQDLDTIFRTQAAKLASQGVESVYDLTPAPYEFQGDDRGTVTNLLNKRTGDVLREARLQEGWEEDPTAVTFKKTKNLEGKTVNQPIELQSREEGFDRWGYDTSVEGMAHYGINFVDGVPVFTPYYKDTSSKIFGVNLEDAVKTAIAIAAIYYGGSYLLGGEAAAAGATAGTAGTGAGAGTGAAAGTGAGISGAGLTSAEMALLKGAETYGAGTAGLSAGAGATGFSLLEGAQFPVEGLQGVASTAPSVTAPFATATTPGFQASAIPGLSTMGGAQGLTIPVAGGTITGGGLIPASAPIPLGGGSELSLLDAARRLNNLRNLTFKPPQPGQQQQPMRRPQSQFSLPAPQPTVVGLLPLAERYRRSLI